MFTRVAIFLTLFLVAILVVDIETAAAETPTTTFSGTVYYKNFNASGATVSVNYGMQTFTTNADEYGNYNLTVNYVGNGKAVLIASYNGDTDQFTWYPESGAHIIHDFWITPRPAPRASEGPAATFTGRVYYGDKPAKDAHVIIVYGKYILDQYANDTGYYGLTIYYQGMPGQALGDIWRQQVRGLLGEPRTGRHGRDRHPYYPCARDSGNAIPYAGGDDHAHAGTRGEPDGFADS